MDEKRWDVKNKICLITGGNSGIGKETAIGLAKNRAHVIIACRNRERGENAVSEIREISGNPQVDLMIVDLASQKSIRSFVSDFKINYDSLHILINNAGVHKFTRNETIDGFEENFAVNYLAPFLLTNLMLDVIKKSAPSRIINVSSRHLKYTSINFDDLQSKEKYEFSFGKGSIAYCQSKLAMYLFTCELAKKLKEKNVIVNSLCPGPTDSNLTKDERKKIITPFYIKIIKIFYPIKHTKKGAETSIYLASSPTVEGITGKFFQNKKESPEFYKYYNENLSKRLWDIAENLTKLKT